MNEANSGTKATQIVKCEKHGLRYNAATQSGCVRCRREGGEAARAGPVRAAGRTTPQGMSLIAALAVSALLILAMSFVLFWVRYQAEKQVERVMEPDGYEELSPEEREQFEELFREP
ncbi:MAG: hypothetical protein GY856_25645 [bacterium]|nr:hypothetical protein [bacterium]